MLDVEFLLLFLIVFEYVVIHYENKNYIIIAFFNLFNAIFIVRFSNELNLTFAIFVVLFILIKSTFQFFAIREFFKNIKIHK